MKYQFDITELRAELQDTSAYIAQCIMFTVAVKGNTSTDRKQVPLEEIQEYAHQIAMSCQLYGIRAFHWTGEQIHIESYIFDFLDDPLTDRSQ